MLLQSHVVLPRDGGSLPSARACASSCSHVRIVEDGGLAMFAEFRLEVNINQDGLPNLVAMRERSYAQRRRDVPSCFCNDHGYH